MPEEPFEKDNPFTKEQVDAYNRSSHFEADINKEFNEDVTAKENETRSRLKARGVNEIPQDVKTALWYYRKAIYNYFIESSRSRSIAPPVSVVGPANYSGNTSRANSISDKALSQVDTAKKYLDKAVSNNIKGKVDVNEIDKWLPLAQKAGSAIKFGKLYTEKIKEELRQKPESERTGWDSEQLSGNWDHVHRGRGRLLYKKLIPNEKKELVLSYA